MRITHPLESLKTRVIVNFYSLKNARLNMAIQTETRRKRWIRTTKKQCRTSYFHTPRDKSSAFRRSKGCFEHAKGLLLKRKNSPLRGQKHSDEKVQTQRWRGEKTQ
ncbi:hypothetical protein C3V39_12315 [Prevotella sp. oral taxon 820]|nr:hypothetical protein C3V39_12315 [Prevotella sp. oral taxon 820]